MTLSAWLAARKVRREHRREHRAMGVCPDCGFCLAEHRLFRHGASRWV